MHGIFTIYRKEMEDHFSSMRFLLIAALIVMVGVIIASMVGMGIQEELKGVAKPNFVFLLLSPRRESFSPSSSSSAFSVPSSGSSSASMPSTGREPAGR